VTLFSDVIAAEILWTRRKLHSLKMVTDKSPDDITYFGHQY